MAWDEWEQLKAQAAEKGSTGMRLNQLPADPGGGGQGVFVAYQDDLGAVGHEAFILHDHLNKQADIAGAGMDKHGAGSTMQAAASLKNHNFTFGSALETTVTVWDNQVKTLLQACAHISNHLDYSKKMHANDDAQVGISLHHRDGSAVPVSEIDKYFK
ncbi:hypothetical protein SLUN_17540 [Streptomyces lunaelactis]|uniref:AG1 protein n=1 Tax=Streptomyces lunaelactis TaxID=1535768 RepID=A0A2R4T3N6_9ACTN|nr:hypothetical protein [Streptomyces lunaelactis]AVZ73711.1 hypothetical protein SLUN_17540 [Streptomyces lunaelactis]NUK86466.1 hypothetical protein [Streptomyces lunaelactis]